jgi:hypothetical protein
MRSSESKTSKGAADTYVQIVSVAPNDAKAWRRLADVWLLIPSKRRRRRLDALRARHRLRPISLSAIHHAGRRVGKSHHSRQRFRKREEWRQALNALKVALTLHETPELKTAYDALREKYGFRVSNFSIDSDASTPRACFQFSESLPKRTDFSPYVAVSGEDKPALSVEDQQLCVEGLQHGETYAITLRAGLPFHRR